ncbi:MAG: hypothetical protein U0H79_04475 [Eubacterium sp.]|nr:hypothetical protein [Eubacterium sp.]
MQTFANRTIRKQEATIKELQNKISVYKEQMNRMNEKLLWYSQERAKFKGARQESVNSGANLLIKQIVDDIVESGVIDLEVKE